MIRLHLRYHLFCSICPILWSKLASPTLLFGARKLLASELFRANALIERLSTMKQAMNWRLDQSDVNPLAFGGLPYWPLCRALRLQLLGASI